MSFIITWNSAFETLPQDTEAANLGAGRIRDLKEAARERLAVEHYYGLTDDANSGIHKFPIGNTASRPVAGLAGRLYLNTDRNTVEFDDGAAFHTVGMEVGTVAFFHQATAPTGWTRDTSGTYDDYGLRINGGAGVPGINNPMGANGFSAVFAGATFATAGSGTLTTGNSPTGISINNNTTGLAVNNHALTNAEIPQHTHNFTADGAGGVVSNIFNNAGASAGINRAGTTDGGTGGGGAHGHGVTDPAHNHGVTDPQHNHSITSHTHTIPFNLKYVDLIRCVKA
jgi:hypothetical protein